MNSIYILFLIIKSKILKEVVLLSYIKLKFKSRLKFYIY